MSRLQILVFSAGFVFLLSSCIREEEGDLEAIAYQPEPYTIKKPVHFPEVPVPADNPMTVAGVQLGRRLFYDPILSRDSTMSCGSCHLPQRNFTDNLAVSTGIDGIAGSRSSMSLLNVAYNQNGLFWDGRVKTLEELALIPVEDPIELHHTWPQLEQQLRRHAQYPELFRKAFGIRSRSDITKTLAAKALAQFMRILISSGNSRFDRFYYNKELDQLDDEEFDGLVMFFDEGQKYQLNLPDAQCFHCHGGVMLSTNNYTSNGISPAKSYHDFADPGQGAITQKEEDRGKFRMVTLRNIALTAPYMHDGRFKNLMEVIEHYSNHGQSDYPYEDPLIDQVGFPIPGTSPVKHQSLNTEQKAAILKFLHTLTDTIFIQNPDIQNPN